MDKGYTIEAVNPIDSDDPTWAVVIEGRTVRTGKFKHDLIKWAERHSPPLTTEGESDS